MALGAMGVIFGLAHINILRRGGTLGMGDCNSTDCDRAYGGCCDELGIHGVRPLPLRHAASAGGKSTLPL